MTSTDAPSTGTPPKSARPLGARSSTTLARRRLSARQKAQLSPSNISIVYIYAAGFILFSAWIPGLWFSSTTHLTVLNISFAVPAMVAAGLTVPLLAGVYDLSIAGTMNATGITVAWLLVDQHWNMWPAMLVALLVGVVAGVVNGILVVSVRINSFIATLATSAVLGAYASWLSGGIQITGFSARFESVGNAILFGGIEVKVLFTAVLAVVLWYVIEHTPAGRYLQSAGDNEDAARLAGVRTQRYIFGSLIVSALVAGFAGIVETATIGAGNADVGSPYLLSAFAAAFLGSTQFKHRFNIWGTIVAVWVLASGVQGVTLALQSYQWLNDLFFGVALAFAVGMSKLLERRQGYKASRKRAIVAANSTTPATVDPPRPDPAS